MNILPLHALALDLVARDFSDGHTPSNGGPTKTSRALAIIFLAARDAYAQVTTAYGTRLAGLPNLPAGLPNDDQSGLAAAIGAGARAAALLYPDFAADVVSQTATMTAGLNPSSVFYGAGIGDLWVSSRLTDMSALPQTDTLFSPDPGRHRPDPLDPKQTALGRNWGKVTPFVLTNVAVDAPLGPPADISKAKYAKAFDDVFVNGRDDITQRKPQFRDHAVTGIFWAYDGSNKIGTPPRIYNKVVVASSEFQSLPNAGQINALAAINAAMADAGIAAWHWKYFYDFWRPVVAIREAEDGWGPTGKGDGNPHRKSVGDPFWLPLGAPRSNPPAYTAGDPKAVPPVFPTGPASGAAGKNFTPNFPAYPSGHATFGTACFETFAALVRKQPAQITVTFVSSEFNGTTTDNEGVVRPRLEKTFTLSKAIEDNKVSRIYLGVHWEFDASGGEKVGHAVADLVAAAFTIN